MVKIKSTEELEPYGEGFITWKGHDVEFVFDKTNYTDFDADNAVLRLNGTMPDLSAFRELSTISHTLKGELRVFMNDNEFVVTNRAGTEILFYTLVEHELLSDAVEGYAYGIDYGYILYDFDIDCLPFTMAKSTEVYSELFDF